jgi:hypothetical protein
MNIWFITNLLPTKGHFFSEVRKSYNLQYKEQPFAVNRSVNHLEPHRRTRFNRTIAYNQQAGKVTNLNPIHPPAPSQMEYYFQAVGVPVFILDVSRIKSQKLKEVNSYKLLVYGATDRQVMPAKVTSDFDLVIHTDTTTGAKSFYLP